MVKPNGSKPTLTRASAGTAPDEDRPYTAETRDAAPGGREPEGVGGILEALKGAGQVGIYRQKPTWARGYLQTLNLGAGEGLDFEMLDQLQRYWGGGTYSFRPMLRGRFNGSTQPVQFDGPTLFQGQPHPKDPDAARAVAAEVLPPPPAGAPFYGHAGGLASPQPPGPARPSPELALLGGIVERIMGRMDQMEARLTGPSAPPAQAPDQIAGVLSTLKLAQQIGEMWNPRGRIEEEDEEEEAEAWQPKNPQEAMMALALKKLEEDPDAFSKLLGGPAPTTAPPPPPPRPRLVRGPGAPVQTGATVSHAPPEAPPTPPNPAHVGGSEDPGPPEAGAVTPAQILAQLAALTPSDRAVLVNQIGQSLDAETLAALAELMPGSPSAAS